VAVGGRRWLAKWPESGPTHGNAETGSGCFWATLGLLAVVVVAVHGGGDDGRTGGSKWWQWVAENCWKIWQKRTQQQGEG